MVYLAASSYLGFACLLGYLLICLISPKESRSLAELVGVSIALGLGAIGTLLMDSSFLGIRPGRLTPAVLGLGTIILLIGIARRGQFAVPNQFWPQRTLKGSDLLRVSPMIFIVYILVSVVSRSITFETTENDAVAIWEFKAREVALSPIVPRPAAFYDPTLWYSHLRYPLLVPFMVAGSYQSMGGFDDRPAKAFFALIFLAIILLSFGFLRTTGMTAAVAILFTATLIGIPAFARWAGSGMADVPLACFSFASAIFLVRWIKSSARADLIYLALFSGFTALTKNEGLPVALLIGLVIAFRTFTVHKADVRQLLLFVGIFLLIALPFFIWVHPLPRLDEDYTSKMSWRLLRANWGRFSIVLPEMGREMFDPESQGCVWILLMISAVVGYRGFKRFEVQAVWVLVCTQLALYAVIYVVSPLNLDWLLGVSVDRLIIHLTPLAMVLVGLHWSTLPRVKSNMPLQSRSHGNDFAFPLQPSQLTASAEFAPIGQAAADQTANPTVSEHRTSPRRPTPSRRRT